MTKKKGAASFVDHHFIQQKVAAVVAAVAPSSSKACGPWDLQSPSEKFTEKTLVLEKTICTVESLRSAVQDHLYSSMEARVPRAELTSDPW
ncbi:hypothetical protein GUJ93_ZPchr0010g8127 [Zizania palustris]|uniref:Uncharacterized protein n=1 Tax=Zizania palustris TaxID=103762 RepID=A0A8J5SZ33_ZIZPA|nr:hypothetical protein GUJ93_ZPchr0010g8127 [Zizania palustris]